MMEIAQIIVLRLQRRGVRTSMLKESIAVERTQVRHEANQGRQGRASDARVSLRTVGS
jgi:hypothetical protein